MRPGLMRTVSALGGVSLVLVALAAVLPPVAAGTMLFAPNPDGGHALGAFFVSRILPALRFTVLQAVLSAILAVLVGLPGAFLAARRDFPGRRILLSLSGVPLCVPPVVIALSFVLFYGRSGVLNSVLMAIFALDAPPVTFLYSLAGVVLAHGLYNFPVVLRTVSRAWERLPADREEAALLLGAGPFRVFRTITMPALAGPLVSSALLVFLYCFFSFVIVLMFGTIGGTTLEVELYQAARNVTNLRGAALIAVVETLCAIGFVLLHAFTRRYFSHTRGMNVLRSRKPLCGIREIGPGTGYLVLLAVFFIGPLCMIVVRSLTVTSGGQYTGATGFALSGWASLFTCLRSIPPLPRLSPLDALRLFLPPQRLSPLPCMRRSGVAKAPSCGLCPCYRLRFLRWYSDLDGRCWYRKEASPFLSSPRPPCPGRLRGPRYARRWTVFPKRYRRRRCFFLRVRPMFLSGYLSARAARYSFRRRIRFCHKRGDASLPLILSCRSLRTLPCSCSGCPGRIALPRLVPVPCFWRSLRA